MMDQGVFMMKPDGFMMEQTSALSGKPSMQEGMMDGDEVVQLYIHQQGQQAIKELKGYQRVHLKKGETKQVIFILKPADLLHYSEAKDSLTVLPGKVEVQVGASSQDIRIQSSFLIKNN